jgi:osmotically-inducible protein OsmY
LFDAFSGLESLTGPVGRAENSLNATQRTTVLGAHPSPILAGTPLDQGNSKADVDTTAQIRKEIVAGKNMSVNAKNVKIITKDGQVTLRGPVNTAEEKRLIGEIADRIARSGNVDNQLEVKLTTSSNN